MAGPLQPRVLCGGRDANPLGVARPHDPPVASGRRPDPFRCGLGFCRIGSAWRPHPFDPWSGGEMPTGRRVDGSGLWPKLSDRCWSRPIFREIAQYRGFRGQNSFYRI